MNINKSLFLHTEAVIGKRHDKVPTCSKLEEASLRYTDSGTVLKKEREVAICSIDYFIKKIFVAAR